jgi:hypothetical protein
MTANHEPSVEELRREPDAALQIVATGETVKTELSRNR